MRLVIFHLPEVLQQEVRERQSADGVSSLEESTLWPPNRSSPPDQSDALGPCWVRWAPSRSGIWSSI